MSVSTATGAGVMGAVAQEETDLFGEQIQLLTHDGQISQNELKFFVHPIQTFSS